MGTSNVEREEGHLALHLEMKDARVENNSGWRMFEGLPFETPKEVPSVFINGICKERP